MPMLDVFTGDAFNTVSLTAAVNDLPYKPMLLGSIGLFESKGITTTVAVCEEKDGVLSLIPTAPRGGPSTTQAVRARTARSFVVPHLPHDDTIMADDIQNVRSFGEETETETAANMINERMMSLRQSHEVTHEYMRIGAVKGTVLDADGSTTIFNYETEFGSSRIDDTLAYSTDDLQVKTTGYKRKIENRLGGAAYSGFVALCGDTFWDGMLGMDSFKTAWERWQDGAQLRDDRRYTGVDFMGITWYNYRGNLDSVDFVADTLAYITPIGVPEMYLHISAPANFVETANTVGQTVYAKQRMLDFDRGIHLHTQSNPLMLNTRPGAVCKVTGS